MVHIPIKVENLIPVKFRRVDDHLILIASHGYWKEKICDAITNQKMLDINEILKDDSCDLGHWLNSEAEHPHLVHLQSYHNLKKQNAEFHIQAAKVAEQINEKKYAVALRLTECTSAFESASNAVIAAIFHLKKDVKKLKKDATFHATHSHSEREEDVKPLKPKDPL
ncbi:MAG: CZB domain-containing protein [Methylococcales bacterium]|nr:CZB domain-containing protein [Methylococcales bacterium]MDD5754294.1 CZB domain-containing protein [Methylococcales bacterium]